MGRVLEKNAIFYINLLKMFQNMKQYYIHQLTLWCRNFL